MVNICIGCGLCCDGTMFSCVDLQAEDRADEFIALGLKVQGGSHAIQFRQPCSAAKDGCCAIYDVRPAACREYRCELRLKYDEGALPLASAQEIIGEAISLRDAVRPHRAIIEAAAGATKTYSLDRLYRMSAPHLVAADAAPAARQVNGLLLLDMIALSRLLARHFRAPTATAADDEKEVMK